MQLFESIECSHPRYFNKVGLYGWKALFARSKDGPLLPNLHTLIFDTIHFENPLDETAWLSLFLSPSLRQLIIRTRRATGLPDLNMFFIGFLTAGSYPAYSLDKLPHPIHLDETEHPEAIKWLGYMNPPDLTGLQTLTIRIEDFENGAHLVGLFPLLECLEVIFDIKYSPKKELPKLPPGAFPRLYHFGVFSHRFGNFESSSVWGLKAMLSKLTSVELCFLYHITAGDFTQFMGSFFPAMREHSPSLTDLAIRLDFNIDFSNISNALCDLASQLPIQNLYFSLYHCGAVSNCFRLVICPRMRQLEIADSISIRLFEIRALAELFPNLEYLSASVEVLQVELNNFEPVSLQAAQSIVLQLELKNDRRHHIGCSDQSVRYNVSRSVIILRYQNFELLLKRATYEYSILNSLWPNARHIGGCLGNHIASTRSLGRPEVMTMAHSVQGCF